MEYVQACLLASTALEQCHKAYRTPTAILTGPDVTDALLDHLREMDSRPCAPGEWTLKNVPWRTMIAPGVMVLSAPKHHLGCPDVFCTFP